MIPLFVFTGLGRWGHRGGRRVQRLASSRRAVILVDVSEPKFTRQVENMVAEIRGLPGDDSRSRRRPTRAAADLIEHLLHKHRIGMKTPEEAIRDAWTEIVGEPNAQYCHPMRVDRERVLIVGVSNPIVRQELMFHKPVVLARIRAIPAAHLITDVAFRAG